MLEIYMWKISRRLARRDHRKVIHFKSEEGMTLVDVKFYAFQFLEHLRRQTDEKPSGSHSYKVDDGIVMETIAFRLKHSLQHPRSSIHPDHQHKPANIAADAMPTK